MIRFSLSLAALAGILALACSSEDPLTSRNQAAFCGDVRAVWRSLGSVMFPADAAEGPHLEESVRATAAQLEALDTSARRISSDTQRAVDVLRKDVGNYLRLLVSPSLTNQYISRQTQSYVVNADLHRLTQMEGCREF